MAIEQPPVRAKGDAQAIIDALEKAHVHIERLVPATYEGSCAVAFLPSGVRAESLKSLIDEYLPRPERMTGTVQLNDLDSLGAYINRHKRNETIVFVDDTNLKAPKICVVFDAHEPESVRGKFDAASGDTPPEALAGWNEFRAVYPFPVTPEWEAWLEVSGSWLLQADFATFLEERVLDVVDPTDPGEPAKKLAEALGLQLAGATKLLELSRGLTLRVNQTVINAVNLSSGEGQITFEEKHADAAGQPVKVPGAFAIAVPVFRGGALYRVPVRLRYRQEQGRVKWALQPHGLERVFEDAIEGAAKTVREMTAVPVLRGRPSA